MTATDSPIGAPAENANPAPGPSPPRGADPRLLECCVAVSDELHRLTAALRHLESRLVAITEQIAALEGRPEAGAGAPAPGGRTAAGRAYGIIVP